MELPENIAGFIKAQNDADSTAFASFFTEHATVFDEGSSYTNIGYRRRRKSIICK
jgi:hypothetical protein